MKGLVPTAASGLIAVLVGFTSSIAIIFQATQAAGATTEQTSSWIFALCLGAAVTSIGFSLRYRQPILAAWSTPGAALLGTSLVGVPMAEAIGAFLFCGIMIAVVGYTGWFQRVATRIPMAIASAMLAGILFRFGLDVFVAFKTAPWLVLTMLAVYLAAKRFTPRYAVLTVLAVGALVASAQGLMHFEAVTVALATPVFTPPAWNGAVLVGVGIPLFAVTMASQNLPGVAVLKASGYDPPLSPVIGGTGVMTALLAPFGAFGINLAAITAAICTSPDAHQDPKQRYVASTAAGVVYLLLGLASGTISTLFAAFPKEFVLALAGIALFGTIGNSLASAVKDEWSREAAVITLLVTASGVTVFGVGSAFWGLLAGFAVLAIMRAAR
jgi:benzoate membrane transport protein